MIAAHLGLSLGERKRQAAALLSLMGDSAATTTMLGEFNDWFWVGSVPKVLARALPAAPAAETFPSICPLLHLDRIYCRPREARMHSCTDPSARAISDHLPVIGDVRAGGHVDRQTAEGKERGAP